MEHVQPLQRSFPWRAVALTSWAVLLGGLAVFAGSRYLHTHTTATDVPAKSAPAQRQAPVAPVTPLRPRSHVSVLVLNGNGVNGAAGHAATRLLHHGYRSATSADAQAHDYATSLVLYRPGWQREAHRLAHDAGARVVAPLDGRLPAGSKRDQLVLILGR